MVLTEQQICITKIYKPYFINYLNKFFILEVINIYKYS